MKDKTKKNIIIALIISIAILIILITILIIHEKNKYPTPNITGTDFQGESVDTLDEYYPKGTFNLTKKYEGTLTNKEITDRTSEFIKLVIAINDNQNEEYFKENRNNLRIFGITTQEQFDSIEQKIKSLGKDEIKYVNSRFDADSATTEENYLKVSLYINFEDCSEIEFTEKIQNDKSTSMQFIFE